MKQVILLVMLVVEMMGCRVKNIDTPASTVPPAVTPAVINTSAQGSQAASAVLQSKELIVISTNIFTDLGFISQSQMVSAVSTTGTGTCADYGSYDYTSTYNGNGSYNVTYTFSLCRQNNFQYDGTFTASGNPSLLAGIMSSGLKILNFQNNYKTLVGSLVGGSLAFSMQGSGTVSNATYTISANGGMQAFDYYSLGQHSMWFNNLATNYTVSTDAITNIQTRTFKANGGYSVNWTTKTAIITYSDFNVGIQKQLSGGTEDATMAGRIIVNYTPNSSIEGAFDVTTATPIRTVMTTFPPVTTQGNFTINNTATAAYGTSDTISVSVAGDTPLDFTKEFMLMKQANFYALAQQLPIVSGPTGTASGNVMSISALSTGPTTTDLNCYTDVHVNYYTNTNPTTSDSILWYVDWHQSLSTCTQQSGLSFQQGTSSTGVTGDPCDVGLDINGANFDITSGGVEHFLAAALPAGYYVLSINNYSCATTVHNAASLLIGDYLFGTYSCSYTSSDGESSAPGAWCRLADIRVNAGGTIDVLAPDGSLNPWHP